MLFVLISWVTVSVLFCLALLRAAAHRQPEPGVERLESSATQLDESPKPTLATAKTAASAA